MKTYLFNSILLFILFISNNFIYDYNFYFSLIYICLLFYHAYILLSFIKYNLLQYSELKNFVFTSILIFLFSYFIICDPNPFSCIFFYYIFYPNFIKAVLIIIIHTYFLNRYIVNINKSKLNLNNNHSIHFLFKANSFFLSEFFNDLKKIKQKKLITFGLIIFIITDIYLFLNKTYIWVKFNKKHKTLPILTSKDTKFFIASNIFNMEKIIDHFIHQMKLLINYLGQDNVIISFVENGDSNDNTRQYLKDFQNYLNEKNILNKFILENVISDPRKEYFDQLKYTRLRIEYYSKLRNKCLEYLYELSNIDFNNTMILFFNDVIFNYEDIIKLLSTNKETYDMVCAMDMSFLFYDRWVSIDLNGEGMMKYFPFFINKEGQDLVINHRPIRVFSCWNGIIAFKALPLKDKNVQFRYKNNNTLPNSILKNPAKTYFESECTYFNIDYFSLGYTKKFINPDVRVSYDSKYFFKSRYFIPSFKHIANYFWSYFVALLGTRNKHMSNYVDQKIKLNSILNNWYYENAIHNGH